jgi:hypothetical protein
MKFAAAALTLLLATPALAQSDTHFKDGPGYAKIHVASGFVCPATIGPFERDAQGEKDVQAGSDVCSYAALDGVYGTIVLTPLDGPYNPRQSLAPQFVELEGTGGKKVGEKMIHLGGKKAPSLSVYTRTYRTARAEALDYRTIFAGAQIGNWAVEVTVEYADPRDTPSEKLFLNSVFGAAAKDVPRNPQ